MQFEVGDVVRLKSGGPFMTVKQIGQDTRVWCTWFNESNGVYTVQTEPFQPQQLKKMD